MGSDYEQWKKRRDAERARHEREQQGSHVPPAPSSYPPQTVGTNDPPRYSNRDLSPAYTPAPPPLEPAHKRSRLRSCFGCLGLFVGFFLFLTVGLSLFGFFYWRQIENQDQVNVLILGIDERSTERPPFRSDTMILTAFNPQEQEVAMLSIPRDLWVSIPGHGWNRINTAHFFGWPDQGPELAKETVRTNFGVPLSYYVKINFDGFTKIIDAMGGITVDVPERLYDENYPTADYGVTTIDIPAGVQEMDGETALIYARSRYSTSDFDRSRRQQEIISAVRNKAIQPDTWLKIPAIWGAISSSIETDMAQNQWPKFALIVTRATIERFTLGPEEAIPAVTSQGAQILQPNWERINPILAEHFE